MRKSMRRIAAAAAAGATVSALGTSAAAAAVRTPQSDRLPSTATASRLAVSGAQLWIKRYNGPGNKSDEAKSVAVSSSGRRVYVTGRSTGATSGSDYLTIAYNAATGARLWTARYSSPASKDDIAQSVAVSPTGATVFVTGQSAGPSTSGSAADYATVAYRASDGKQLWVARYNGPGNGRDQARAVSVARDGGSVFVTGTSAGTGDTSNFATVAYQASDGKQLWVGRYGQGYDQANAIVSPGGNRVFVTGSVNVAGEISGAQYATVAYNAATGAQLWARQLRRGMALSMAASPDLRKVYVTGWNTGTSTFMDRADYTTAAYDAATGNRLWVRRYDGPRHGEDVATSVTVNHAGTVFVTGRTGTTSADYATVAYTPVGAQLWAARYNGSGRGADIASSVVSPGNGKVYVTGTSDGGASGKDYATVAYGASTGAQLWVRRYNGPGNGGDVASSVASADGRVFVSGSSEGKTSGLDYATIAYRG